MTYSKRSWSYATRSPATVNGRPNPVCLQSYGCGLEGYSSETTLNDVPIALPAIPRVHTGCLPSCTKRFRICRPAPRVDHQSMLLLEADGHGLGGPIVKLDGDLPPEPCHGLGRVPVELVRPRGRVVGERGPDRGGVCIN